MLDDVKPQSFVYIGQQLRVGRVGMIACHLVIRDIRVGLLGMRWSPLIAGI